MYEDMSAATALAMAKRDWKYRTETDGDDMRETLFANGMATALEKCTTKAPLHVIRTACRLAFPHTRAPPRGKERQFLVSCCLDDKLDFPGLVARMSADDAALFMAPLFPPDSGLAMSDIIGYHALRGVLGDRNYQPVLRDYCVDLGVQEPEDIFRVYLKRARGDWEPENGRRSAKRPRLEMLVEQEVVADATDDVEEDDAQAALILAFLHTE